MSAAMIVAALLPLILIRQQDGQENEVAGAHAFDRSGYGRSAAIWSLGTKAALAIASLALSAIFAAMPAAADEVALPDPVMTPGSVNPSVSLSEICNGTTKGRRRVTPQTRAKVLRDYSVTEMQSVGMELDHLVPLAIGGSNVAANLWPQPSPDYEMKDVLEREMQRRACVAYRTLTPADAAAVLVQEQREIAEDWVAAYQRYIGPLQALR